MSANFPRVIFLMGPTASGKTGLALELAARFDLEILNADSMQVYQGMEIGGAAPTPEEMEKAPHHLFAWRDPADACSAGRYERAAKKVIAEVHDRGRIPLLVGGTGLYFHAVEGRIAEIPDVPEAITQRIRKEGDAAGWGPQYETLKRIDPAWAERVTPGDAQRILRGLSVFEASGVPLTEWHRRSHGRPGPYSVLKLALRVPREELYQRIDRRFDLMMAAGFLREAKELLDRGLDRGLPAMKAVGYRQLFAHLDGELSLEEAVEKGKVMSRRYAKRQMTWLNSEMDVCFLGRDELAKACDGVTEFLK